MDHFPDKVSLKMCETVSLLQNVEDLVGLNSAQDTVGIENS